MRKFTKIELGKYNGKNGMPIFVACQGKVYDLSRSFLWKKGKHQVLHKAGLDLTEDLKVAPHGAEMLDKFPLVGILEQSS